MSVIVSILTQVREQVPVLPLPAFLISVAARAHTPPLKYFRFPQARVIGGRSGRLLKQLCTFQSATLVSPVQAGEVAWNWPLRGRSVFGVVTNGSLGRLRTVNGCSESRRSDRPLGLSAPAPWPRQDISAARRWSQAAPIPTLMVARAIDRQPFRRGATRWVEFILPCAPGQGRRRREWRP
jgi:hypothetical protein